MNFKKGVKVAVVSGNTRGIGKAIAENFESMGMTVIGLSRNNSDTKFNRTCDIRNESEVKRSIQGILEDFKVIDILINNAGIVTTNKFSETDLNTWNNVINTNLTGAFLLCKHVLPHMKTNKSGKIVNVSSIAARNYSKTASTEYTVSKYGLVGLTKQLAHEYGEYNININCICPSQTRTTMLERNISSDQLKQLEKNIPLKKLATTNQVANVVSFLCSEESSYMHGAIVDINGGLM